MTPVAVDDGGGGRLGPALGCADGCVLGKADGALVSGRCVGEDERVGTVVTAFGNADGALDIEGLIEGKADRLGEVDGNSEYWSRFSSH